VTECRRRSRSAQIFWQSADGWRGADARLEVCGSGPESTAARLGGIASASACSTFAARAQRRSLRASPSASTARSRPRRRPGGKSSRRNPILHRVVRSDDPGPIKSSPSRMIFAPQADWQVILYGQPAAQLHTPSPTAAQPGDLYHRNLQALVGFDADFFRAVRSRRSHCT